MEPELHLSKAVSGQIERDTNLGQRGTIKEEARPNEAGEKSSSIELLFRATNNI
jgi:hypothetical protein